MKSRRQPVAAPPGPCYITLFHLGASGTEAVHFGLVRDWNGHQEGPGPIFLQLSPHLRGCRLKERRTGRLRRRHDRTKKRLVVRFGTGELAHSGYTQDVSESGIYLQAGTVHPPGTILYLQIDFPEGSVTKQGVVRWCKDVPAALQRSLRGGMGLEFTEFSGVQPLAPQPEPPAPQPEPSAPAPPSSPAPRKTTRDNPPPEVNDKELARGATQRRQVSTLAGNTFEILQTEYHSAFYVRAYQLPRSDGSQEAIFAQAFWTRDEAALATRTFLKDY